MITEKHWKAKCYIVDYIDIKNFCIMSVILKHFLCPKRLNSMLVWQVYGSECNYIPSEDAIKIISMAAKLYCFINIYPTKQYLSIYVNTNLYLCKFKQRVIGYLKEPQLYSLHTNTYQLLKALYLILSSISSNELSN